MSSAPPPPLRVLFINDLGFQYGAGVAHLRQIQSFLLLGHEVSAVCQRHSPDEERSAFDPTTPQPRWLGMRPLPSLHPTRGHDEASIIEVLLATARHARPDLVVVGNLHGASWPVRLPQALQEAGHRVVAYMHDAYLVSGRCAYPGDCRLYEVGCDETCPTATEYPVLEPARIPAAWRLRREVFCGARGVPLAANSSWTLGLAQRGMPDLRHAEVVYYGLDERLFRPIDRRLARRLLGVPEDRFVVLAGAVNLHEARKGGPILRQVIATLGRDVHFLLFGVTPPELAGVQSAGFSRELRRMPVLYSAADVFLGTSLEEAFGQTFCEAAACGVPAVAFRVGGIPEVARHDVNARLVDEISAEGIVREIDDLRRHPESREEMGRAGRAMVEAEFTLRRQGERWMEYLRGLPS